MDAREALCDDRLHTQLHSDERGLFARRSLPVVVAGDDEAATPRSGAGVELRVVPAECVDGTFRDVRPQRQAQHAVRRHVTGRDVISEHNENSTIQLLRQGLWRRGRDYVLASQDLDAGRSIWRKRVEDVRIDDGRSVGSRRDRGWIAKPPRVRSNSAERGGGGDRGRAEIDLVALRAAASGKITVERPDG